MQAKKRTYRRINKFIYKTLGLFMLMYLVSCEDFVAINPPNTQLSGVEIFEDIQTVEAALIHSYSQLRDNVLTVGNSSGMGYLLGLYSDELVYYGSAASNTHQFYQNSLIPSNSAVSSIWKGSYKLIYEVNTIIEGIERSNNLPEEEQDQLLGEAYFLRAFLHFHLLNLYGDIPYVDTTDYRINSKVSRMDQDSVYEKIIEDLKLSKSLVAIAYMGSNKVRPNKWVVTAFLARVYLYDNKWSEALQEAQEVILKGSYTLNNNITAVFLKNSTETLWQFDAEMAGANTKDASTYVLKQAPPQIISLAPYFIADIEAGDARFSHWIGSVSDGVETWYFPYKYKQNTVTGTTEECSIVIRLAEMFLIVAEANAQLGNSEEALVPLNAIRERANLSPITATASSEVLEAIYRERKMEFFTELGHRFFDLKRTGTANKQLTPVKLNWKNTSSYWPIPESELILNPNLEPQNQGY